MHLIDPRDLRPSRLVRSPRVHALLSLGLLATLTVSGTWASWSDTVEVTGTTITTGTLDLKVNDADTVSADIGLNYAELVPGGSSAGLLRITNDGTLPFRYALDASVSNDVRNLAGALTATVTTGTTSSPKPPATCSGTALAGSGTSFRGALITSANRRTLAPGASETLCVQATLATNASTELQGASSSIAFTVTADQVP